MIGLTKAAALDYASSKIRVNAVCPGYVGTPIRLTIEGTAFTGTLNDNPTAKDFLSLLPLTLTLEDYAATEKITYLPRKLLTANSPAGSEPSVGDVAYYAPSGR